MLLSFVTLLFCVAFAFTPSQADQSLIAARVNTAPVIDGSGEDEVWADAKAITVSDKRAKVDVKLKAVYTNDMVFFLVQYQDTSEDRLHKPWIWDKELNVYKTGNLREDSFTFKWNMEKETVDLSNFSDNDYTADVWYWKAHRTNPVGYADDKSHILASEPGRKAKEITSKSGKKRYLMRLEDEGSPTQKNRVLTEYQGDFQGHYIYVTPDGSRADVLAKGDWKDRNWIIEFGRKLNTGHPDDIQFNPASDKKYQFGISIFGLHGDNINETAQHGFGQGRISETLYLVFR
ncbi:MAG: hypothetical protein KAJ10_14020 [Thermodesulfovibrionia bacterium]|nr:hypothetical protein [Thermodesulfovibrionia bacterium]